MDCQNVSQQKVWITKTHQVILTPRNISASKTMIFGGRPWKFGVQYWHYIKSPDNFGPDYQIRVSVSPVVKLPW